MKAGRQRAGNAWVSQRVKWERLRYALTTVALTPHPRGIAHNASLHKRAPTRIPFTHTRRQHGLHRAYSFTTRASEGLCVVAQSESQT
jgi:hypothetical protein